MLTLNYTMDRQHGLRQQTFGSVQKLFGREDVTTMIYTNVLNRGPAGVRSPVDGL